MYSYDWSTCTKCNGFSQSLQGLSELVSQIKGTRPLQRAIQVVVIVCIFVCICSR